MRNLLIIAFTFCIVFAACRKEDPIVFTDNNIPPYDEIPTVIVENYVNRIYIDVLGREPLDVEMEVEVNLLEQNALTPEIRYELVDNLMFNQSFVAGDSSYNYAYFFKVYEDTKARLIEGASDDFLNQQYGLIYGQAIADSINGDLVEYQAKLIEAGKVLAVLNSREEYRNNEITIDEMYARMMNNAIYDQINMNSFNFVNASFDDLYFRFPTSAEFDNAYDIIENNNPNLIFGEVASNKLEYLNVLTGNDEYREGLIRWAYLSLLAREPSSNEVFDLSQDFQFSLDIQEVQKQIIISDEYAGFD